MIHHVRVTIDEIRLPLFGALSPLPARSKRERLFFPIHGCRRESTIQYNTLVVSLAR